VTARAALISVGLLTLLFFGGLSFGGCSGGGTHRPFQVELAPTLDCGQPTADLPPDVQFFTLQICPSTGMGGCVPFLDPSADHGGMGVTTLRIPRPLDLRFTVDARIDASIDYDVSVVAYSGGMTGTCTPYALGHALGVRFGRDNLRVRLYPLGGWSCAGTHEGQMTPMTRALHQAVLLPNREVLILGGVAGPTAGSTAFAHPALAQRIVEVFDPQDARFHPVAINDEDGMPGFSRVMFQARYISTNASGQYEIHTYGGFDVDHAPEGGVGFDGNANATTVSALFGPLSQMMMGTAAGFRSDAVILYDPHARTATVRASSGAQYTTAAATDGMSMVGVVRSITSVMVSTMGRPSYGLQAGWYVDGGSQGTLQASRLGASITALSATRYLIWGGDVATSAGMALDAATVVADAGELATSGSPSTLVPGHDASLATDDGRPFTTAYHTATRIAGATGATPVLFAGGLVLGAGPAPLGTAAMASPSLTVARYDATGAFMSGQRIAGRIGTVLHTASSVDASMTDVLLVGGASQPAGMTSTLFAEKGTGLVSFDPTMSAYTWHALPDMVLGRWGHTATIIPNHGVLVVGGMSRMDATLNVTDSAEFLLWEDLRGTGRPMPMSCSMPTDAGPMDAGPRDVGPPGDMGPPPDMGPPVDAGPHDANTHPG
jgi:hypothetical protein